MRRQKSTSGKPQLRLEYRDPAEIKANPSNWRKHPESQAKALQDVIAEVGWAGALLLNERTGRLIDGHLRKDIANGGKVPVLIGSWTEAEEKKILATLDPIAAMAQADKNALEKLLAGVQTDSAAIQGMLESLAKESGINGKPVEDPGPQLDRAAELQKKWKTKPGQLWTIGKHRLLCGDSTKAEDMEMVMGGERLDALLTDPPYSSGGQFRGDRSRKTATKYIKTDSQETCRANFAGDNRDQRAFLSWASLWLSGAFAASKDGSVAMVFTDWRQLPIVTDAVQCGGWVWRNLVTWWKPGIRMQCGRFSSSAEYVVYASNGVPAEGEQSPQNVIQVKPVSGTDKQHIAEKPSELIAFLLGATFPRALIYDPFLGSGTTIVAAEQLNRRCFGIEIEPKYVAVCLERLAGMGLEPELA